MIDFGILGVNSFTDSLFDEQQIVELVLSKEQERSRNQ